MTIRHRHGDGTTTETYEANGGVFSPIREKNVVNPAWIYGPKNGQRFFFTCPVSSIPSEVMELLTLWWACHMTKTLPLAGGFLDQPLIVQQAFPFFEAEHQVMEAST